MNILKHTISILLVRDEDGNTIYDLDTIEKIENFKPRVYQETKYLSVIKETKKFYTVVDKDEDGTEETVKIFKELAKEGISLNTPIYAQVNHNGLTSVFYTLKDEQELKKGRDVVYDHFENEFNIQISQYKKLLDTLKKNF